MTMWFELTHNLHQARQMADGKKSMHFWTQPECVSCGIKLPTLLQDVCITQLNERAGHYCSQICLLSVLKTELSQISIFFLPLLSFPPHYKEKFLRASYLRRKTDGFDSHTNLLPSGRRVRASPEGSLWICSSFVNMTGWWQPHHLQCKLESESIWS